MNIRKINRSAVDVWLKGARLPLSAVEAATGRGRDGEAWAGSLAFDKAAATARTTIGRLTGDDELVAVGRLQDTATTKRLEAEAKKAEAEEIRAEARRNAEAQKAQIEDARQSAEERAAERERELEAERAAAEEEVEKRASRRRTATKKAARARNEVTDRKETRAKAKVVREEAEALKAAERAVAAEATVLNLDRAVRAKRNARKTG